MPEAFNIHDLTVSNWNIIVDSLRDKANANNNSKITKIELYQCHEFSEMHEINNICEKLF